MVKHHERKRIPLSGGRFSPVLGVISILKLGCLILVATVATVQGATVSVNFTNAANGEAYHGTIETIDDRVLDFFGYGFGLGLTVFGGGWLLRVCKKSIGHDF